MREPFLAVGLSGMCVSLGLAMSFWKLAPAASMALVGGLAGAIAGLVGLGVRPGEPSAAGSRSTEASRRATGTVCPLPPGGSPSESSSSGSVSLRLARAPTGFPASLRRASVGVLAGGVGLAWVVRNLLDGECARLGTPSCSETPMVAGSIILDAVAAGNPRLVSASATPMRDVCLGALRIPPPTGSSTPRTTLS